MLKLIEGHRMVRALVFPRKAAFDQDLAAGRHSLRNARFG